jgi:transcriptional regulator with XRE-family HTH domain
VIGELLRQARQEAGLTQEELAFRAGVHRTYVSLVERNLRSPTIDVFIRLCDAMSADAGAIVSKIQARKGS